jgi:Ni/Fe-hydrogenase subunit HybB-like protein
MGILFWVEMLGGVAAPILLLSLPSVRRNGTALFCAALLVIGGLILNRFNVSLVGWARPADSWYWPHWMELAITVGIVASGVLAYGLAARFLPLFAPSHSASSNAGS